MTDLIFKIGFPLVLLILLIIIFISGRSNKRPVQDFMSGDEFIKDWLKDHGQAHKVEESFAQMKKDPAGRSPPIPCHGGEVDRAGKALWIESAHPS